MQIKPPVISFALPLGSEQRWSDLLAVLIATDPGPLSTALGLCYDTSVLTVHREVTIDAASRPDIVLRVNGICVAVIEVRRYPGQRHCGRHGPIRAS